MAVALLPLAPILLRYRAAQDALGLSRNLGEMAAFSADIAAPLCAPAGLTFWGWLRVGCGPEGELFAGAGLVGLCLVGALWRLSAGRSAGAPAARGGAGAGLQARRDAASPGRLRRWAIRLAVAAALAYLGIAAGVALAGPWRLDLGWFRASASSIDKPATVAFVLLLAAALVSRRFSDTVQRGEASTFYLLAAAACWILSWGPFPRLLGAEVLYQAPFAWLLALPGVGGLRVPARFWMVAVLCLAVFMGTGAAHVLRGRRTRWRAAFVTVAAGALLMDGWTTIPAARVPAAAVAADAGLRGRPVAVLPIGDPVRDAAVVYHAVTGGWRAINGYSGYEPVYYEALRTLTQDGDPRMLDPFRAYGDLVVVDSATGSRAIQRREPAPPAAMPRGTRTPVQAVDASCSSEAAALAHDGDLATAWVCGTQSADHELTADLGRVVHVGAIVHALGVSGSFFPRRLVVETSVDGAAWTEAWSGSPAYAVLVAALAAPRETAAAIDFAPREARFVRLRQTGRHEVNYWAIAELEIWSGDASRRNAAAQR
jgi:hypothetical protein